MAVADINWFAPHLNASPKNSYALGQLLLTIERRVYLLAPFHFHLPVGFGLVADGSLRYASRGQG